MFFLLLFLMRYILCYHWKRTSLFFKASDRAVMGLRVVQKFPNDVAIKKLKVQVLQWKSFCFPLHIATIHTCRKFWVNYVNNYIPVKLTQLLTFYRKNGRKKYRERERAYECCIILNIPCGKKNVRRAIFIFISRNCISFPSSFSPFRNSLFQHS